MKGSRAWVLIGTLSLLPLASCGAPGDEEFVQDDVGLAAYCEPVSRWPRAASEDELALLDAINRRRSRGDQCGETAYPPVPRLDSSPELRCAARRHAEDQAGLVEIGHLGTDGSEALERVSLAGYSGRPRGELLAARMDSPEEVVAAWMESEAHCEHLMDRALTDAGVGRASFQGEFAWVLNTGEPFPE